MWEKEKASVMVVTGGLYEINMGFYSDKKPTVQLLINGEPVLSNLSTEKNVVQQHSVKSKGKNSNLTGNNINF